MKQISDYTVDELFAKIEAIKAERERTAEALKRYEEELEHRKQEVPLGVPFIPKTGEIYWWVDIGGNPIRSFYEKGNIDSQVLSEYGCFQSKVSAEKHAEILLAWRKALVANSKGEQIDIKVLRPLLPKSHWVACDSNGEWFVFSRKPFIKSKVGSKEEGIWDSSNHAGSFGHLPFNIKPAENWRNSLMECGL